MAQLDEVKKKLRRGTVYRRGDITKWSKSVDRDLHVLVEDGTLQKLSQGLYYYPKTSAFGVTPPSDDALIKRFLNDDRFLVTSPNDYNSLGVGTTQLYNSKIVYNHKRHGVFKFGNRIYSFRIKPHFPNKLTPEFLLVDLINNLESLAEDGEQVKSLVKNKAQLMNRPGLKNAVAKFGGVKARQFFSFLNEDVTK